MREWRGRWTCAVLEQSELRASSTACCKERGLSFIILRIASNTSIEANRRFIVRSLDQSCKEIIIPEATGFLSLTAYLTVLMIYTNADGVLPKLHDTLINIQHDGSITKSWVY